MTGLATLLIAAAAGLGLARWLALPMVPVLLLSGIVLGLVGLTPEESFTSAAVQLGLAFLLFAAGIELHPKRFVRQTGAVLWTALLRVAVTGLLGWALARGLGFGSLESVYLALALSSSSTLVAVRHLKQRGQMFEPYGRLVTGVVLVQDLLLILLIVLLARLPEGGLAVVRGLGEVGLLTLLAVGCQRWLMPRLIPRLRQDEEVILLIILASLYTFIGLALQLRLPIIAGAFLAGLSLSAFPVSGVVRGLLNSLSDFFLAIFFTALGAFVTMPPAHLLAPALLLAAAVVLLTPPLVTAVAEWNGFTSRAAIESGLALAQASELALVAGLSGLMLGQIRQDTFSVIVLVTVLTMSLTPFLATDRVTHGLLRFHPLRRRLSAEPGHRDHILLLGFGASGMWVVKPLLAQGHTVVVVDDDPVIIEKVQNTGIPCIRGDGSDDKILEKAGARQARLIIASMRRVSEAIQVLRHVPDVPVVARVFEEADADQIRALGGIPILNSAAAADTFMEWFEKTGRAAQPLSPPPATPAASV